MSGPAGVALGFVLYAVCRLLNVSAQSQWRLLSGVAAFGAVVILLAIQPEPALRGTLSTARCRPAARHAKPLRKPSSTGRGGSPK